MNGIVVAVPVLWRPTHAQGVVDSLAASTRVPHRLIFIASRSDQAEIDACRATGADVLVAPWEPGPGDYAKKMNYAFAMSREPFFFQGADDIVFQHGWDVEALRVIEATATGVCGTNDEGNARVTAGLHSTHSLIRRSYVDECGGSLDGPGIVFAEVYGHQFTDTELVELAKARDCWSFAPRSVVTHLHPFWGKATEDATYAKGQATGVADRRLYERRRLRFT